MPEGLLEPFTYARTFLDLNDTLSGVVEGEPGRWQSAPHGVVVAPDGNVWVGLYAGSGRQEILPEWLIQFITKVFMF